jgi:hypothetical protein
MFQSKQHNNIINIIYEPPQFSNICLKQYNSLNLVLNFKLSNTVVPPSALPHHTQEASAFTKVTKT